MNTKLEEAIRKHSDEVAVLIKEAYSQGYYAAILTDRPTQADFDRRHKDPVRYGEELGLVLSGKFTFEGARRKFKKYYDEQGLDWPEDDMWRDHISSPNISYEMNEEAGEPTFYLRADRAGIYEAWFMEYEI